MLFDAILIVLTQSNAENLKVSQRKFWDKTLILKIPYLAKSLCVTPLISEQLCDIAIARRATKNRRFSQKKF